MYFATQPRPALTAVLLQIWQWCPEKIILPSHRWKKMTIAEVYTWQLPCFQLLLLFAVATYELVLNY